MRKINALILAGLFIAPLALSIPPAFSAADSETRAVAKLIKIDHKIGDGAEAVVGKTVEVHYTGWLYSPAEPNNKGRKFDSSVDRGTRFSFPLGEGRVIQGWDTGVVGMKVGGQRTLVIPADLGYGARGAGRAIPPNAALIFDVELFNVR